MLWIALHLPLLSLESLAASLPGAAEASAELATAAGFSTATATATATLAAQTTPAEPPLALLELHRIHSANGAAQALGVKPGMKRATALALAPNIVLGQADPVRDARALAAVAHAALAFTPQVVVPPACCGGESAHIVLLDVTASLRYFGGLDALRQRLHAAVAPLGHRLQTASATTPHGAALLSHMHRQLHCADLAATRRALEAAPVWLLGPGREHGEALLGMGLRTLGDLLSMPRSGLARRFGAALLDELDRALGTQPDPREPITLPPVFESRIELFCRADTAEQVLRGAGALLARLIAWLAARHAFVRRFTLVMAHETFRRTRLHHGDGTTRLDIALAEPSRDAVHLHALLRERLALLQLPAPTLELQLHAADIACRAPPSSELFPTARSEREGIVRLIERLQARLGHEHIQRLGAVADHRPERATAARPADISMRTSAMQRGSSGAGGSGATRCDAPRRPVWLLPEPERLGEHPCGPLLRGRPLQLLGGPERIEAGWWDAALAERDYFIAQTEGGALVWIYRTRPLASTGDPGWFLQGRFG